MSQRRPTRQQILFLRCVEPGTGDDGYPEKRTAAAVADRVNEAAAVDSAYSFITTSAAHARLQRLAARGYVERTQRWPHEVATYALTDQGKAAARPWPV